MPVWVDAHMLSDHEVRKCIALFNRECEEFAGQFFDQNRSEKFRAAWTEAAFRVGKDPQLFFVEQIRLHFAEHVRRVLAGMLADPKVREADKRRIHRALIIQSMMGEWSQYAPVQLAPGTQQFEGDKYENRQIAEKWGTRPGEKLVNKLMNGTARVA